MERHPPRLAVWLATRLLRPDDSDRLLGDLDEEYAEHQVVARGGTGADLWYWRQVLVSIRYLRVRRGARAAASRVPAIESVVQDVRYAFRGLLRSPGYAAATLLTFGLGVGATTAIFSVVHAVVLRSLPYESPERIVRAWDNTREGDITEFSFRVVEYRELRQRTDVFEAVGAEFPISATLLVEGHEPHQVQGRMVTPDFFRVFGVEPRVGRMFTTEEIAAGDRLVAVVTHGFWMRHLSADPRAVGQVVRIDGRAFTILGVLPASYEHVSGADAQLFIPYTIGTGRWTAHWLDVYARLRDGVTSERAADEINAVLDATSSSGVGDRWYATVEGLHEMVVGDVRPSLWAIFGIVAMVLLLACVNVANLSLARFNSRSGEVAIRRSVGAGRGRIMRQFVVESLVVAVAGGLLGVMVARVSLGLLIRLAPPTIPRIGETTVDSVVLAFTLALSVGAALVFGLGPAATATRDARSLAGTRSSRGETGGRAFHRILGALVIVEVALALTLLVAAGLTVATLQNLQRQELGFDRAGALTFRLSVPADRYPSGVDVDRLYSRLREGLGVMAGVSAVGAASDLPVSGEGAVASVTSKEAVTRGVREPVTTLQRRATAGFFRALGTPVLSGREFDDRDRPDGPGIAIVSESLARALFGDEEAVGRQVGFGGAPGDDDWLTIVGVVADVRYENVERVPDPQIYQAHPQSAVRDMALVLRARTDPRELLEPARSVLAALDPEIPMYSVNTLGGLVDMALAGRRFTATLAMLFAAVALALTVAGLYGVLSFVIGQRRREIGVRIAVGARRADVVGLVLKLGLTLVGCGIAAGLGGAILAGRLLRGLLFGVPSFDPAFFGALGFVLLAVGIAACLLPALAASRVDPLEVLREG